MWVTGRRVGERGNSKKGRWKKRESAKEGGGNKRGKRKG